MTTSQAPVTDAIDIGAGVRQGQFPHALRKDAQAFVRNSRGGSPRETTARTRGQARNLETARAPDHPPTAEENYADLVARYGKPVRAYVARLTRNRNIADDVYQETLLRAWRHRQALVRREGSARSWLYTVAHNAAVDVLRGRRAYPVPNETWDHLQRPVQDHADAVVATAYLMPALRRLSAEHRDVIFELYYRRSTVAEAAKSIGIPPGTVKSRAHYAVRALRAELVTLTPECDPSPSARPEDLP